MIWRKLNKRGRLCLILCGLNIYLALFFAYLNHLNCWINLICAFTSWLGTYHPACLNQKNNS